MKIEITECSPIELLELLSAMNANDQAELLIGALAWLQSVHSDNKAFIVENGEYLARECSVFLEETIEKAVEAGKEKAEIDYADDTEASLNDWINNGGY